MAVAYPDIFRWNNFKQSPETRVIKTDEPKKVSSSDRSIREMSNLVFKEARVRGEQFVRDAARLMIKTPPRFVYRSIVEKCLWKQRERAIVNGKMTLYSFVQFGSLPVKFVLELVVWSLPSWKKNEELQNASIHWTQDIDVRRAKLEALKEEGLKHATQEPEYLAYEQWIRQLTPL
jgi:hypothetical protein